MNLSDVVLLTKNNESFSTLIALDEVITDEKANKIKEDGYYLAFSLNSFNKNFPDTESKNIYFSKGFTCVYYWDPKTLIIFPIHLHEGILFSPTGESLKEYINNGKKAIKKCIDEHNYYFIITSLPDRMRIEYFKMLIDNNIPNLYDLFITIYTSSDFGFSHLRKEDINKIFACKTNENNRETKEAVKYLPDIVTIYRGCGSESTELENAYSWSIDNSIAVFFATRFQSKESKIYSAKVKKEDILEFIDGSEKECLIMPDKVFDIVEMQLYNSEWLENKMSSIIEEYIYYKNKANYKKLPFTINSELHGRAHSMRVLFFCLLLANIYQLPKEDKQILIEAALYHDIGRKHDNTDTNHGYLSANKYKNINKACNPIIPFLIEYHCKPDECGERYLSTDPILSIEKEHVLQLFYIFKDADALDRVRLGHFELNIEILRTKEAKKLPLIANITYSQLKNL